MPAWVLKKFLFFQTRVSVLTFNHLSVQQQEYALARTVGLLVRKPELMDASLLYKTCKLVLSVVGNLAMYLQKDEFITEEEHDSWRHCEDLLLSLLRYLCVGEPMQQVADPYELESYFGAYFLGFDGQIPDEFDSDLTAACRPLSDKAPPLLQHAYRLMIEDMLAYKPFLLYVSEFLKNNCDDTRLCVCLLQLLSFKAGSKVSTEALAEAYSESFNALRTWSMSQENLPTACELTRAFCRVHLGDKPSKQLKARMLAEVSRRLYENDCYFKTKGEDLFPDASLLDLCSLLIEFLQQQTEQTVKPTKAKPSLALQGYSQTHFSEPETQSEEFCTYHRTGTEFEMQHWYYCYTCDLVENKGACSVCARKCHRGHDVVYSRKGNFFCDCGDSRAAGGCQSLPKKIRHNPGSLPLSRHHFLGRMKESDSDDQLQDFLLTQSHLNREQEVMLVDFEHEGNMYFGASPRRVGEMEEQDMEEIHSETEEEKKESEDKDSSEISEEDDLMEKGEDPSSSDSSDEDSAPPPHVPIKQRTNSLHLIFGEEAKDLCTAECLTSLCLRTLERLHSPPQPQALVDLYTMKTVEVSKSQVQSVCSYKACAVPRLGHEDRDSKDALPSLKNAIAYCKPLDLVLMAENNKVLLLDSSLMRATGNDIDRSQLSFLSKHTLTFPVTSIVLNPLNPRIVALHGLTECVCLVLCDRSRRGLIKTKVTLTLTHEQGSPSPILKAQWLPGSQCELAIATSRDIKVFNLAKETLCPLYCFVALDSDITDFCMVSVGRPLILASCQQGILYRQSIASELEGAGQIPISDSVVLPQALEAKSIVSLSYLQAISCFALSLSDYKLVLAAMDPSFTYIVSYFELALNADPAVALNFRHTTAMVNMQVASMSSEVVLVGVARKAHSFPVLIKLTSDTCVLAPLRKSSAYLDGLTLYSNGDKDYVLCHSEDGSLLCIQVPKAQRASEQPSMDAMNSWLQVEHLPESVTMQTPFFEKCVSLNGQRQMGPPQTIRGEVTITGDPVLVFGSSKVALEKLSYDRNTDPIGLSSSVLPDPRVISLGVAVEGNSLLLAGIKCFVEAGSGGHIEFLNRKFKLSNASKRWYDIPLCDVEIVKTHLQGKLSMKLISGGKTPLKLFYFEVFAITSANFNLDQKLQEVSKAVLIATGGPEKASEYKLVTDWKVRQPLLAKCDKDQQLLISQVMALVQVTPRGDVSLPTCQLIYKLFEKSLLNGNALFRTAAKDAIQRLLEVQGKQHCYQLLKAMHLGWLVMSSSSGDEVLPTKVLKTLSNFAKDNFSFFAYVLSQFPLLLTCLFDRIKTHKSALTSSLEDLIRVAILSIQHIANKAIFDMQLSTPAEVLQAAYILPQALFQEPCQVLCELLTNPTAELRRAASLAIYKSLKKKNHIWLKQLRESSLPSCSSPFLDPSFLYRGAEQDLPSRLHILLSNTGADSQISIVTPDVSFTVLYWVSGLTPSADVKVDSSVGLTCKLLKALEKQWLREDLVDARYFERIAEVIVSQIQSISIETVSEQQALFLYLVNALIAYEGPEESSHSRKISSRLLSILLRAFPKEAIISAHQKIAECMAYFINGRGSIKAECKGQVVVGVTETKDKLETVQAERDYLSQNWDVVMDCKGELYEELDQFLMVNLMDFVYNVVKGWKECPQSQLRKVAEMIYPAAMQTVTEEFPGLQEPWMDLFCSIFYEPVLSFARQSTQRVFRLVFTSDADFHRALDSNQYSNELSKLVNLASSTNFFQQVFQYDETVALTTSMRNICTQVCKRPLNWKLHFLDLNFNLDEILAVQVLLRSAFNLPESTSSACLALVAVLFEETPDAESMLGCSITSHSLEKQRAWGSYIEGTIPLLIDLLLLESTWSSVRKAAGVLLKGLLTFANKTQSESIVKQIFSRVEHLPPYGACTDVFLQVVAHILKHCQVPAPMQAALLEDVIKSVEKYSIVLDSKQNCEVYENLKDLLSSGSQRPGFSGYILEPEPCVRCFEAQFVPFLPHKIQDLQAETKFSDCCQFIKLKDIYTISEITINMTDARGHKAIRSCSVYISNRDVHDLTELKSNWSQWSKVTTTRVNPASSGTIRIEFAVPVTALNLVIEYQTINVLRATPEETSLFPNKYFGSRSRYTFISTQRFDSRGEVIGFSIGSEREVLPCPRCNKMVEDRHGICSCGENVYQCIQCRNINYEKLDAFLCNECGVSRYCKLEISFMARPGMACESINTQKDLQTAEAKVEKLLEGIQTYFDGLEKVQENTLALIRKIQRVVPNQEKIDDNKAQPVLRALNPAAVNLANLFAKEYKSSYQNMIKSVKNVNALRKEMQRYRKQDLGSAERFKTEVSCYGCVHGFILNVLLFLQELDTPPASGVTIVESVFKHCLLGPAREVRQAARKALHQLTRKSHQTLLPLHGLIDQHLTSVLSWGHFPVDVIREDIELVLQSCAYETHILDGEEGRWEESMRFFWKMFFMVMRQSWVNGSLAEFIPGFLELVLEMVIKNLVLGPGPTPKVDPETEAFLLDNPILLQSTESPTNSHSFLVSWLLSSQCALLYPTWQSGFLSFSAWSQGALTSSSSLTIPSNNWLMECLLKSSSQRAQDLSKKIFLSLAWTDVTVWRAVFSVILASLDEALRTCRQGGDYYFALLEAMVVPECPLTAEERVDLMTTLLHAVEKEVGQLVKIQDRQECMGVCTVKIALGHGLDCLLEFMTTIATKELLQSSKVFTHSILNSYLGLMKLSAIKNKVITESQSFITKLFDLLREEATDTGAFLRECVVAMHSRRGDPLAQSLLCELVLHIVNPERPPAVYYLHLDKSPSQEEFIRGNMDKNPYSSKELGPLMKNVRERICKELELTDPELLELLVAESIVSPELPITSVYEKVLWPALQQCEQKFEGKFPRDLPQDELPNMVVIYRLIGLDGEATENRIDSLPGGEDDNIGSDVKYQATAVLSETIDGYTAIADLMQLVAMDREEVVLPALDLLAFCCKLKVNRLTLMGLGGASVLVNKLTERTSNECLEKLLIVLESVVMDEQATQLPDLGTNMRQHVLVAVTALQDRIERKSALTKSITRILPFLCYGSVEAMQDLYQFFKPFIQYEQVETLTSRDRSYFDAWVELLSFLPPSNQAFRSFFHECGLTVYLCQLFSKATSDDLKTRNQSTRALLLSLASLVKGHPQSQATLQSHGLIAKAYQLSQEYSTNKDVGGMCEALVESIAGRTDSDPSIRAELIDMIERDKEAKRDLTKRKQVEAMQELKGMSEVKEWVEVDEEPGLACVICQEGYTLKPEDLLGFYIYAKPVTVSASIESPSLETSEVFHVSALVTHFNCIHLSCHEQAARAERNMKKPKPEWEGATIRNQHTKCNNWFPIKGPAITEDVYTLAVERLCGSYETLEHRARNSLHDLRIMLHRFTVDESFSKDAKGGGPEHNLQVIPYMIQLSLHLLGLDPSYNATLVSKKDKFLSEPPTANISLEQFEFCMCLMLVYSSPNVWAQTRSKLQQICAAVARDKSSQGSKRQFPREQNAPGAKPVLVLTLLVDLIFRHCFEEMATVADTEWTNHLQVMLTRSDRFLKDRCSLVFEEYKSLASLSTLEETLSALHWDDSTASAFRSY